MRNKIVVFVIIITLIISSLSVWAAVVRKGTAPANTFNQLVEREFILNSVTGKFEDGSSIANENEPKGSLVTENILSDGTQISIYQNTPPKTTNKTVTLADGQVINRPLANLDVLEEKETNTGYQLVKVQMPNNYQLDCYNFTASKKQKLVITSPEGTQVYLDFDELEAAMQSPEGKKSFQLGEKYKLNLTYKNKQLKGWIIKGERITIFYDAIKGELKTNELNEEY
jgi:hypothetical protein